MKICSIAKTIAKVGSFKICQILHTLSTINFISLTADYLILQNLPVQSLTFVTSTSASCRTRRPILCCPLDAEAAPDIPSDAGST